MTADLMTDWIETRPGARHYNRSFLALDSSKGHFVMVQKIY